MGREGKEKKKVAADDRVSPKRDLIACCEAVGSSGSEDEDEEEGGVEGQGWEVGDADGRGGGEGKGGSGRGCEEKNERQ